jgi:hypothetical protein
MFCTSIQDSFPEEGLECLLSCMQADGSFVELIGYRRDGEWVIRDKSSRTRACSSSTLDANGVCPEDSLIKLKSPAKRLSAQWLSSQAEDAGLVR